MLFTTEILSIKHKLKGVIFQLFTNKKQMTDNQYIIMVVRWNKQLRRIEININDDLNTIEKAIINIYQLQQVNCLDKYQIQYYDSNYEKFMDLYSETFGSFQKLLSKLLLPEASPKNSKEWILKIVPRTPETMQSTIQEPATDDTYSYQQENDQKESFQNEELLPTTNNIQPPSISIEPRSNIPKILIRVPTLQNDDVDQQETVLSNNQSPQLSVVNSQLGVTSDHPYGLHFVGKLAEHQRQQYESEMIRVTSSKSIIGGCLLQACQESDTMDSNAKQSPVIYFEIPADKYHLPWSLDICVLTEADKNGIHYLHASKGIYDHDTNREDKFGMIPNSKSFNPYVVKLSQDNLRDGKYKICVKVCNIRALPEHKLKPLREFSRLDRREAYDDRTLLSQKTTRDLNFSSEKYHLGCILFCGGISFDRCISNLTTAVVDRRRKDSDQSNQREVKEKKRKPNEKK